MTAKNEHSFRLLCVIDSTCRVTFSVWNFITIVSRLKMSATVGPTSVQRVNVIALVARRLFAIMCRIKVGPTFPADTRQIDFGPMPPCPDLNVIFVHYETSN